MEKIHTIKTISTHGDGKTELTSEENNLKIGTLNIKNLEDLTKTNLVKELQIQRNNLMNIYDDNIHGYLTPRDVRDALWLVKENINYLINLIIQKRDKTI
tara:strand:+ start:165 stop:464 length:300 start_codon:yes stop_codon:yes gene_type:complete